MEVKMNIAMLLTESQFEILKNSNIRFYDFGHVSTFWKHGCGFESCKKLQQEIYDPNHHVNITVLGDEEINDLYSFLESSEWWCVNIGSAIPLEQFDFARFNKSTKKLDLLYEFRYANYDQEDKEYNEERNLLDFEAYAMGYAGMRTIKLMIAWAKENDKTSLMEKLIAFRNKKSKSKLTQK
jgi:hypothetical protein